MWRTKSRRRPVPLAVTRLEDRTLPAGNITVTVGANGSGSLDSFLFDATPGTVAAADGGTAPGTLSTGALAAVGSTIDIDVRAQGNLTFNDLGGTLTLSTGPGHIANFTANPGSITVANPANTLATSGGGLFLGALANLAVFNLSSGGGNVGLSTGSAGTTLTARSIQAGAGSVNVSNSGSTSATVSQTGTVVGGDIIFTGGSSLTVDDLRGARVNLQSKSGSLISAGANPIQATVQLILVAETGIAVNTLAAGVAASNHASGTISITQAASPARPLATLPAIGIANQAPGGSITVINLGDAISVAGGATVVSNNGPIILSAQDFNIGAAVNSGTAQTTFTNSVGGRPFDLGTNTAGNIGLTQAELNNVTAEVLQIGRATAGAMNISAPIGPFAGFNTLVLLSGGSIGETSGTLAVPNLRLAAAGADLSLRNNNVGTLAATASGNFRYVSENPLIVGTVDGASGVTAGGTSLFVDRVNVQQPINAGSNLLTVAPITALLPVSLGTEVSGQLSLTDSELARLTGGILRVGSAQGGGISINSGIARHSGYNTLSLLTAGTVTQSAPLAVANLLVSSTGNVTLTNAVNDVDTLAASVTGTVGNFSYTDASAVAIGIVEGISGVSSTGAIQVSAGGAITDGNGAALNLSGGSVSAVGGGGIDADIAASIILNLDAGGPITVSEADGAKLAHVSDHGSTTTLDGGTFTLSTSDVLATTSLVIAGATLDLLTFNDTVGNVQLISGSIGGGTLTSTNGFDVRSGTISAKLAGGGGLTKSTTGTVTLSGANTYTGPTVINGGTLRINGSLAAGSAVTVNGGTLGGTGTTGPVSASVGAIAPGNSPGLLTANGNVSFGSSAAFVAEVNGATPGTQYDQIKVNGTVSLGGGPLNLPLGGGFVPAVGTQFVLIDNDGTDAVTGTFNGLPAGASLLVAGQRFTINYAGGTGNDVVLTKAPVAIQSVTIDDGTAQRSMVRSLTVTFAGQVTFAGPAVNAFILNHTGPGSLTGLVTLAVDTSGSSANQTVARLTFLGPLTEGTGSLIDGNYTLTVLSGQIQGGLQGGDSVSNLHRLSGDVNGDKAVNGLDLTAFRGAFGSASTDANFASFLDFDGNGAINGTDLTQFRNRFGVILP